MLFEISSLAAIIELYNRLGDEDSIYYFLCRQYIEVQYKIRLIEKRIEELERFYQFNSLNHIVYVKNSLDLKGKFRYVRILKYLIADTKILDTQIGDITPIAIRQKELF